MKIALTYNERPPGLDRTDPLLELHIEGDEWKTIIKGGKIGKNFKKSFPVVTAQMVRLNILEATNGPTIEEFQLMK